MKTERRHELQTNELADYLGKHLQKVQPYYTHILVGIIAVVALSCLYVYTTRARTERRGRSWGEYFSAFSSRDADALDEVAKLHEDTAAAIWAHQSAGDFQLATGAGQLYTDRDEAKKTLEQAIVHFEAVEQDARSPMLRRRARFALGQVYECLFDVEKAREYYEKVASDDSALGKAATAKVAKLSEESTEGWYAWFERQKPPEPTDAVGTDIPGPSVSDDLDSLPDRPSITFPGGISDPLDSSTGTDTGPIDDGTADDGPMVDLAPADNTPADDAPADDAPAEGS
jgi:hypothetical protein